MQGAEIKDEGSVLKYMTKSEIDEQRSSLHIMTQRHKTRTLPKTPHPLLYLLPSSNSATLFFNATFSNSNILIRA